MDAREPFSEESFRYAAECRRLARFARKPATRDSTATVAYLRLLAWLGDARAKYAGASSRPDFFGSTAGHAHR
jgi:hypothetical protein